MIAPINGLIIGQAVSINGTNEIATIVEAIPHNGYGKSIVVVQYRADSPHRGARQGFEPDQLTLVAHPHVETVISRAIETGAKITDQMVADSYSLRIVAAYILLTYKGQNGFVQSVCDFAFDRGFATVGQMRGVLNVAVSDARNERAAPALVIDFAAVDAPTKIETPATQPALPNGTYTVYDPARKNHTTIRLTDAPDTMGKTSGTQIAAFLSGADNTSDYTGCAFVNGRGYTMWKKYRNATDVRAALDVLLTSNDNGFTEGRAYAMQSGNCFVCNRKLTTPESITAGIGPICADKLGIDTAAILAEASERSERVENARRVAGELFQD
jgi:hypothetical protein